MDELDDEDPDPTLLKGSHDGIVRANIRTLTKRGFSPAKATKVAMRHAKTGRFVKRAKPRTA